MKLSHIPWLVCLLLVGALAFYFWKEQNTTAKLLAMKNEQLQKADLELGRAKSEVVSQKKAHATAMANLDKLWKKEIDARDAAITAYGQLEALYRAEKKKQKTVTKIVYRDKLKDIEIPEGDLFFKDEKSKYHKVTSLGYKYKDFRITIEGDAIQKVISYKLHQKFKAQFVATKLPSGGVNHYAEIYEVGPDGKQLDRLELTSFEVIQAEDLPSRFMWFNPKLDLMIGGGINSLLEATWVGDIGLSLMAYGKTPNDLTWRFLRIGAGVSNHGFSATIAPVQLNLGQFLPVISNTYLSPYAGITLGNDRAVGHTGLGIGLVF